jgi:glutaminase
MDTSLDRRLFDSLGPDAEGNVYAWQLLSRLGKNGIMPDDPRVQSGLGVLRLDQQPRKLTFDQFTAIAHSENGLVVRALEGSLAVRDLESLKTDLTRMLEEVRENTDGEVASYIPKLAEANPEHLALAVCTVDGQQFSIGDDGVRFCAQSVTKPFMYAAALEEHGALYVHSRIGQEQNGGEFNMLALDSNGRPHNPMINSGAMGSAAMIRPDLPLADRYDHMHKIWARMGARPTFDNATYLSEKADGDRNYALISEMRKQGAIPREIDPREVAEFYFQNCSIEVDSPGLAAAAATLANGGRSPFGSDQVFGPDAVRNVLSQMSTSGMYDYSGEFFREIGRPGKSGVSGAVILVVPDVMAVCVYSPKLDERGNSVRGIEFCKRLAAEYKVHVFETDGTKRDLRGTARELAAPARDTSADDVARRALGGVSGPVATRMADALAQTAWPGRAGTPAPVQQQPGL